MKLLHQLGHKKNWNAEAFYENHVGDGFIFCAYSNEFKKIGQDFYGHKPEEYMPVSFLDLQFYGGKNSVKKGELKTYPFHPTNYTKDGEETCVSLIKNIKKAIEFQEKKGFKSVIIPHIYNITAGNDHTINVIKSVNEYLIENKKDGFEYYMTLPFGGGEIRDDDRVEQILQAVTDMKIKFDGYYVVCEQNLSTNRKISEDDLYYKNLSRVFVTLKNQGFKIIHGFSNVDALVFSAIADIDFVSIGTYEVQRSFNIKRYTEEISGGGSKGWYFSEKLLSFIRSQELEMVRINNGIQSISNENNIFSDAILKETYAWNIHKPEVHKNYLVSMSNLLKEIGLKKTKDEKINFILSKISDARNLFRKLEKNNIFLTDESSGRHLPSWQSILTKNLNH